MKNAKRSDWLEKAHFIFIILFLIIYFVVTPFLLVREYRQNKEFRDSLICEEEYFEQDKCLEMKSLSDKSNNIITFVLLYWFLLIFIKDIYPNRQKIKKFLEKYVNFEDEP